MMKTKKNSSDKNEEVQFKNKLLAEAINASIQEQIALEDMMQISDGIISEKTPIRIF